MNTPKHIFRLGILTVLLLMITGMGASTDLTNIGTIYPEGSSLNIEGDLNMSGNDITNSFTQGTCPSGEVMIGINDDGSLACNDATTEVQDDFVDKTGDTMSGDLDLTGNSLLDVDWANSDNPNTDNQQLSISGDTISLDNGGSVTIQDDTIADDQNLGYSNDNAPTGDYATHTVTIDNGNGATIRDYYDPDTTVPDDQDIQASASGDTIDISIDNGNGASATIDDDDASTRCSGNDYLAGDGSCNVDSYEANTDNQDLSNVIGQGNSLSSGQTLDASSGGFVLPTSPP